MICEVCNGTNLDLRLSLGSHPLCDDLIGPNSNRVVQRYSQDLALCSSCLTVSQMYPVSKEILFKNDYHYRSRLTQDVLDGMKNLVASTLKLRPPNVGDRVLDIGCNDGSLLSFFKIQGLETFGVDPTSSISESKGAIDHEFMDYFSPELSKNLKINHGTFEYITLTNVFAHIEDFSTLCNSIENLIGPDSVVVIENHYLGSVLKGFQFDTFYHEHARTYSAKSFEVVAEKLNCNIIEVKFPERYGGNIRVTMSRNNELSTHPISTPDESWIPSAFGELQNSFNDWKIETSIELVKLAKLGKVAGKALPGRAVMLISALGVTSEIMPEIFEKPESPKINKFVPGTDILVSSDSGLTNTEYTDLVVWAWHIIDEVSYYLREIGYKGRIWSPLPKFYLHEDRI